MWKNAYWVLYDYEISTEIMPVIAWGGGGGGHVPHFFWTKIFETSPTVSVQLKV